MPTLVLHPRFDEDSQLLWQAAVSKGWSIERPSGFNVASDTRIRDVVLYGGDMWASRIAGALGITLLAPPSNVMTRLPWIATRRTSIQSRAGEIQFPQDGSGLFVKSLFGKSMDSRVYFSQDDLPPGSGDSEVIVQPPIHWDFEYRAFINNGRVATISRYAVDHALNISNEPTLESNEMRRFADSVVAAYADVFQFEAFVLDVGHVGGLDRHGYAVVEANPAWCSGVYGCDPAEVLAVVAASQEAYP